MKPTTVSLQLADRSIKHPGGVVEDVLIKVDKFIFLVDFIVLDMEEDQEIPLILGRPFLATGRTLIDVQQGKLILRVQEEQVVFNLFDAMKYPSEVDSCFEINILDEIVVETLEDNYPSSPLENCLVNSRTMGAEIESEEMRECVRYLGALPTFESPHALKFKEIGALVVTPSSPTKDPPTLELKPLPSHLRYAFLENSSYFSVIINASLNDVEEKKLLQVLRKYKSAIGWSISNIKGISLSICMHKILMEDSYKPNVQPQ